MKYFSMLRVIDWRNQLEISCGFMYWISIDLQSIIGGKYDKTGICIVMWNEFIVSIVVIVNWAENAEWIKHSLFFRIWSNPLIKRFMMIVRCSTKKIVLNPLNHLRNDRINWSMINFTFIHLNKPKDWILVHIDYITVLVIRNCKSSHNKSETLTFQLIQLR